MRVAIVTNSFPKVSETFIVRQAQFLDAEVVASSLNSKDIDYYDFDYSKVLPLGSFEKDQKTFKDKVINKILNRPIKTWSRAKHQKFEIFLRQKNIEVVLAQFGPNGINALPICEKLNIPMVIQFLGYDASALLKYEWYQNNIKKVLEYSKAAVVLYHGMEKLFLNLGIAPSKFRIINVGIPVEKFELAKMNIKDQIYFLAVGRFVEKKAPLNTIKAFEICADACPNAILNMVGNGVLFEHVKRYLSNSRHQDKIHLHGFLSQTQLRPLYKESHIFLQHSITAKDGNTEGWPVGIAEACASGLPVISTNHAGIPEQVKHGETGFLVEENDITQMAKYMIDLTKKPEEIREMGIKARTHIVANGNIETQIHKLSMVLKEVSL